MAILNGFIEAIQYLLPLLEKMIGVPSLNPTPIFFCTYIEGFYLMFLNHSSQNLILNKFVPVVVFPQCSWKSVFGLQKDTLCKCQENTNAFSNAFILLGFEVAASIQQLIILSTFSECASGRTNSPLCIFPLAGTTNPFPARAWGAGY